METMCVENHNVKSIVLYSEKEIAEKFNLSTKWLYRNRQLQNSIPHVVVGRTICYLHDVLVNWLGFDEIILLTPKQAASVLGVSEIWLKKNRLGINPIRYIKLGRLIRYHPQALKDWLVK